MEITIISLIFLYDTFQFKLSKHVCTIYKYLELGDNHGIGIPSLGSYKGRYCWVHLRYDKKYYHLGEIFYSSRNL